MTIRILLENLLRHAGGGIVDPADVETLAAWRPGVAAEAEIPFMPSRVIMQDLTGVPAVVDLAVMRDAMADLGGDPARVNPLVPADLVIDHSVQVDRFGTDDAFAFNVEREYERNGERYQLLRWAQTAFRNLRIVPPGTGIVHQVNLEYLATVVEDRDGVAFPDTLVGTDSHTTMINALGVLGYGVGGIEAEAVLLGQPLYQPMPHVVGVRLTGALPHGSTATDLVLVVTEMLRGHGVVGAFVEFAGDGLAGLSLADRATISNMSPEFGATATLFPIDDETLAYLRLTGRSPERVDLVERYAKEQGLWREPGEGPAFDELLTLDLATVEPSVAGPRRPQDRVPLQSLRENFRTIFPDGLVTPGRAPTPEAPSDAVHEASSESFPASDPPAFAAAEAVDGPAAPAPPAPPAPPVPAYAQAVDRREYRAVDVTIGDETVKVSTGSVAIAAITSCTNTSNPTVMVGAGLLARNAVARGLRVPPTVKTSLAPGSKAVTGYLEAAGLMDPLEQLGFALAGYGCTTCIGNSGPLDGADRRGDRGERSGRRGGPVGQSELRGPHPSSRARELSRIAATGRGVRAGRPCRYRPHDRAARHGFGRSTRSISPTSGRRPRRSARSSARRSIPSCSGGPTRSCSRATSAGGRCRSPQGDRYAWDPRVDVRGQAAVLRRVCRSGGHEVGDITGARVLAVLGDSVTTDHISPAGSISPTSPAGQWLQEHGVSPLEFNSYGARRGHHEVMVRGTFAQHPPAQSPGRGQGRPVHGPPALGRARCSSTTPRCGTRSEGVPLLVMAGREYGSGSSRDWAAKGTALLGVKAVLAESYERIHRSNLVGMGVLPLQFKPGDSASALGLTGRESYDVLGLSEGLSPRRSVTVVATRDDGSDRSGSRRSPAWTARSRSTTTAAAASCPPSCAARSA